MYPLFTFAETLLNLLNILQLEGYNLIEYLDIFKEYINVESKQLCEDILDYYMENNHEYTNVTSEGIKKELKIKSFEAFM